MSERLNTLQSLRSDEQYYLIQLAKHTPASQRAELTQRLAFIQNKLAHAESCISMAQSHRNTPTIAESLAKRM